MTDVDLKAIKLDSYGNLYTAGQGPDITLYCFSSSGSLQWTANHETAVYALSIYEPPAQLVIPGLPIGISLGIPTTEFLLSIPALGIDFALGIPLPTTPVLPDLSGLVPARTIYRLFVTGGELLELPLAAFQCQRRLGESTWLVVEVPLYSTTLLADLTARMAKEGRLAIQAGVRWPDGTEQLGEFLQAVLTETDMERTPQGGTLRLTARVVPVSFTAQARTLQGIQQRGKSDGKWSVRCGQVDFQLRPNDTVFDGAHSWTAGAIFYRVTPTSAEMRVREA